MKKNSMLYLKLTCVLVLSFAFSDLYGQDGSYVASFGNAGKVWDPELGRTSESNPKPEIFSLADGKILYLISINNQLVWTRYHINGTVDASFGSGGKLVTSITGSLKDGAMQENGKILVLTNLEVLRFNQDATPDLSFDGDGRAPVPISGNSLAIQWDSKILIGGSTNIGGEDMFAAARLLPTGQLDTSFDGDGIAATDFNPGSETGFGIAASKLGKIILGGTVRNYVNTGPYYEYRPDVGVVRYNSDGSLDHSFDGDGKATNVNMNLDFTFGFVAFEPDGQVLVAGSDFIRSTDGSYLSVYRFNADGSVDNTFGSNGVASVRVVDYDYASDLAIQSDRKILVSGYSVCPTCPDEITGHNLIAIRLLDSGSPDPSFDTDGKISIDVARTYDQGGSMLGVGRRLYIAGYSYNTLSKASLVALNISSPLISPNPKRYYRDNDIDYFGIGSESVVGYEPSQNFHATLAGDCNDLDPSMNPGATETSDGKDNDCDGLIDEGTSGNTYTVIPAKIEAENWSQMAGVQTESTSDEGGGINVGWIDPGDYLTYNIFANTSGTYTLKLRLASAETNGRITVKDNNGTTLATVDVPHTGGWQNWITINSLLSLPSGQQQITLHSSGTGHWNINWLEFVRGNVSPSYTLLPAKIEAENWNNMRGVQTEPTSDAGGGWNVGYIDPGDFMEYNVNAAACCYTLKLRVSSAENNSRLTILDGSGNSMGAVDIPNTGGWQNWQTITVSVNFAVTGNQTIRLASTGTGHWNINWLEFTSLTNPPPAYVTLPAKIEAENWSAMNGVQTETTNDAGGGQNVGWIEQGDWIEYNVHSPSAANYNLALRISTPHSNSTLEVRSSGGAVLATLTLPNTGGWQNWQTITLPVSLPAGNQTIRLVSTGTGNWNINWLEFTATALPPDPSYVAIPAKIEAENWHAMKGVQTEPTTDAGGGLNVGYIDYGDWLDYRINVPAAGMYQISFRVASPNHSAQFQLKIGNTVFVPVDVPQTGSYQNWQTITVKVLLEAGQQTVRLMSTRSPWNINWLEFASAPTTRTDILTFNTWVYDQYYFNYGTPSQSLVYKRGTDIRSHDITINRLKYNPDGTIEEINQNSTMIPGNWRFVNQNQLETSNYTGTYLNDVVTLTPSRFIWYEVNLKARGELIPLPALYWPAQGRIQAENWTAMSGVRNEITTDSDRTLNLTGIDGGDWMDYNINVASAGTYTLSLRIASTGNNPLEIRNNNGDLLARMNIHNTGGAWQTLSVPVTLDAGNQTLHLYSVGCCWKLNWLELTPPSSSKAVPDFITSEQVKERTNLSVYPNPVTDRFTLWVNNSLSGQMKVQVIGTNGAVIKDLRINKARDGSQQYPIDVNGLAKGTYIITVQMPGWRKSITLLKQ